MSEYEIVNEPPPVNRRAAWIADFQAWLKQHPGKWAVSPRMFTRKTAYVYATHFRSAGFDAVARIAEDDPEQSVIYARWPDE